MTGVGSDNTFPLSSRKWMLAAPTTGVDPEARPAAPSHQSWQDQRDAIRERVAAADGTVLHCRRRQLMVDGGTSLTVLQRRLPGRWCVGAMVQQSIGDADPMIQVHAAAAAGIPGPERRVTGTRRSRGRCSPEDGVTGPGKRPAGSGTKPGAAAAQADGIMAGVPGGPAPYGEISLHGGAEAR